MKPLLTGKSDPDQLQLIYKLLGELFYVIKKFQGRGTYLL